MDLPGFSFDPEEIPILYATGLKAFALSDKERDLLREYLIRGGTFLAVAHHGSREFSDSLRHEAGLLFPGRPLATLPPDHPLYRSHRRVERVTYTSGTRDRADAAPVLEGLFLGCRVALILSPYDLCCSWDSDHLPDDQPGVRGSAAFDLGVDILAYSIAYYPLGKLYGRWGRVEPEDRDVDRGDFVFAQAIHSGHHDPHPAAFAALLAEVLRTTSVGARLSRKMVSLSSPELSSHPFLYMTGHGDFRLTGEEAAGLRRYLSAGGFLLADSCCGDLGFDVAFRREIGRVLPDARLAPLAADHPIFSSFEGIGDIEYTSSVRASFPDLKGPFLEGIEMGGALALAYSRFDLANGWEGEERPFSLAIAPRDARRLGVNIVLFALTH